MVSQVICVICSVVPEPHTTEITFYKFPKAVELPSLFKAWKKALVEALLTERPEFTNDVHFIDTYVCSRHFIASDFSFEKGKLILLNDAVPSRNTKILYDETIEKENDSKREYAPSSNGNFATTSTTSTRGATSHHKFRSDLICTETSRTSTPSTSEQMSAVMGKYDGIGNDEIAKKRHAELELKVVSYGKIFKHLRKDNVLTESYVDELK